MASMKWYLTELEKFQKSIKTANTLRVKIGIMGDKNMRSAGQRLKSVTIDGTKYTGKNVATSTTTNAEVGAKHEFGYTISSGEFKGVHVPARSFLRYPLGLMMKRELPAWFKDQAAKLIYRARLDLVFKKLGVLGVAVVTRAFDTMGFGTWAPNTPFTAFMKGSNTPLIDTGQLRRSISYQVVGGGK